MLFWKKKSPFNHRNPLSRDRYDALHVFVAESGVSPAAGEGLYAIRPIVMGQLICLFNGVRVKRIYEEM